MGSSGGGCSGLMRYDLRLPAEGAYQLGFICPVLPGRRAAAHQWDGKSPWAQLDEAALNPKSGGQLQPDPGIEYYRKLKSAQLFDQAEADWDGLWAALKSACPTSAGRCLWGDHRACGHGDERSAPDVAVINYNVFNRDGVYVANILQKSGNKDLAEQCIDYFLKHPFNGRVQARGGQPRPDPVGHRRALERSRAIASGSSACTRRR